MSYVPMTPAEREEMLRTLGVRSIEELWDEIPPELRLARPLELPAPLGEPALLREMHRRAESNQHLAGAVSFLGGGMADHFVPSIVDELIRRSEFYTAYTPYQPEVAQGTLQAAYEYQTMIARLTGLDVSNASVHDGANAMAEAAFMAVGATRRRRVVVSGSVHPHYRALLRTYASGGVFDVVEVPHRAGVSDGQRLRDEIGPETACVIVARPNYFGIVEEPGDLGAACDAAGALFVMVTEATSLALLAPPASYGAAVAVGDGQPLGNAPAFGGPTFGYLAARMDLVRRLPARLVGRTVDATGDTAYVLTLQTREQHIRREKATSNICTSSNLNALCGAIHMAAMGKQGMREVATQCLQKSHYAARLLSAIPRVTLAFAAPFYKEFAVAIEGRADDLVADLAKEGLLVGPLLGNDYPELHRAFMVCVTEMRSKEEIDRLAARVAAHLESHPSMAVV